LGGSWATALSPRKASTETMSRASCPLQHLPRKLSLFLCPRILFALFSLLSPSLPSLLSLPPQHMHKHTLTHSNTGNFPSFPSRAQCFSPLLGVVSPRDDPPLTDAVATARPWAPASTISLASSGEMRQKALMWHGFTCGMWAGCAGWLMWVCTDLTMA